MRKLKRFLKIFLSLILVAVMSFAAFVVYLWEFHVAEICRETSPDGQYALAFCQVGSQRFPFGPVKGKLILRNQKGRMLDSYTVQLQNDGVGVEDSNLVDVVWKENAVTVQLREFDTSRRYVVILDY